MPIKKDIMFIFCIFCLSVIIWFFHALYYENRVKNATVIVELKNELSIPFTSEKRVSDLIENINGDIIDDYLLNTIDLGRQKIEFEYINEEGIKIPYEYEIEVVDETPPLVWLGTSYTVTKGSNSFSVDNIMCADDHDDKPICEIVGEYDTNVVGDYKLEFVAKDSSGNETEVPFTLHVKEPNKTSSSSNRGKYDFQTAKSDFKSETRKIGIDVSSWQGDIDFEAVKEAGVEFAFIRVGSKRGIDGEYFLDSKFEQNIKGFNEVGIPVGIYFYSYAKDEKTAQDDAEFVIDHIKNYQIDLPVAFDFEDWSRYNRYEMSLYRLNRNAEVFIETLNDAGYEGMIYGSANYLNRVWNTDGKNVWVAHYTRDADYSDTYGFWQFSNIGLVNGINGYVDLDVMYE